MHFATKNIVNLTEELLRRVLAFDRIHENTCATSRDTVERHRELVNECARLVRRVVELEAECAALKSELAVLRCSP